MSKEKDMANKAIVFFVFLSVLLLLFPTSKLAHTARVIVSYGLYPALHTGAEGEYYARNVPGNFMALVYAAGENTVLKEKIKELEVYRQSAAAVFDENARLASLVALRSSLPWKGVWARVVGKEPSDRYSSFFIGKGAKQGIEPNDTVLGFENGREGLVGRVHEVYPEFSKVLLTTNEASSVPCSPPKGGFEALAEGRETGLLRLNYVCEDCFLEAGTELVTSSGGMLFPGGVRLGRVVRVHEKESFMNFITADVAPAVDISSVKEVFVIRRNLPEQLYGPMEVYNK